jgi:hypothetical protein
MTLKPDEEARGLANYKSNSLKPGQPAVEVVPTFEASDPVIIEWRAMAVATLDRVAVEVRKQLNMPELTLAQVLQGGTWNVRQVESMRYCSMTRCSSNKRISFLTDPTFYLSLWCLGWTRDRLCVMSQH